MNQSYIQTSPHGTVSFVGPDAVNLMRCITLKSSIGLFAKTGMIPTRGVTITKMLAMATKYTGKAYKRGQYQPAIDDLQKWIDTMKAAMPVVNGQGEQ